jgi:hypothetical protein
MQHSLSDRRMNRLLQLLLIATFLPLCWFGMMAVHELGHVIGAYATGGRVARVVLHPLAISRTDLAHNPHPLIVAWSGPVIGVLLPLVVLGVFRLAGLPGRYLVRFFAGFCLIANGAYLGAGAWAGIGDAGDLLRLGTRIGWLLAFGLLTVPAGLFLWHGLGPHFGLGKGNARVEPGAVAASCGLLLAILVLQWLLGAW